MVSGKATRRFNVRRQVSKDPMPMCDWRSAEDLLARLVARAFVAARPHSFCGSQDEEPCDLHDGREPVQEQCL